MYKIYNDLTPVITSTIIQNNGNNKRYYLRKHLKLDVPRFNTYYMRNSVASRKRIPTKSERCLPLRERTLSRDGVQTDEMNVESFVVFRLYFFNAYVMKRYIQYVLGQSNELLCLKKQKKIIQGMSVGL